MNNTKGDRAVYELQEKLRLIARVYKTIPVLNPDGIYGPETTNAVRTFKSQNGIPPTGRTDFTTWKAINDMYRKAQFEVSDGYAVKVFPSPYYVVKPGEKSDVVLLIQLMLDALSVVIDGLDDVQINGVFDDKTSGHVKTVQIYSNIEPTGEVDKVTWNIIVKLYNTYNNNPDYVS